MSFSVSWTYQAIDAFSSVNEKMRKASNRFKRELSTIPLIIKKDIRALKKLDTSTARAFRRMREKARMWRMELKQMLPSMKAVNDKLKSSIAKGLKRAAGAATVGFVAMIKQGGAFEDAMADLSSITGATGDDLNKLKTNILSMSKATNTMQSEVATAVKLVGSQKAELLENIPALSSVTEKVLLLKNASGIELASAAEIATQSLNIFGKGAEHTAKFVDILAAGSKFGASEIGDTGAAIVIAGNNAVAAGLDFKQTAALIQVVAKGGIKGSQAGTALSAILGRLRRQGARFNEVGLGRTFEIIKQQLEDIKDPTLRAQTEAKLFGEEHSKVGLALLKNAGLIEEMTRKVNISGIAQEQANIRLSTFIQKLKAIGVRINEALIKTFDRLTPKLNDVAERFAAWTDSLTDDDIDKAVNGISKAMGVFEQFIGVLGSMSSALGTVWRWFSNIGKAAGEAAAAIATGDFDQFTVFSKTKTERIAQITEIASETMNRQAKIATANDSFFSGGIFGNMNKAKLDFSKDLAIKKLKEFDIMVGVDESRVNKLIEKLTIDESTTMKTIQSIQLIDPKTVRKTGFIKQLDEIVFPKKPKNENLPASLTRDPVKQIPFAPSLSQLNNGEAANNISKGVESLAFEISQSPLVIDQRGNMAIDINVNLNGPKDTVKSIQATPLGAQRNLNLGINNRAG